MNSSVANSSSLFYRASAPLRSETVRDKCLSSLSSWTPICILPSFYSKLFFLTSKCVDLEQFPVPHTMQRQQPFTDFSTVSHNFLKSNLKNKSRISYYSWWSHLFNQTLIDETGKEKISQEGVIKQVATVFDQSSIPLETLGTNTEHMSQNYFTLAEKKLKCSSTYFCQPFINSSSQGTFLQVLLSGTSISKPGSNGQIKPSSKDTQWKLDELNRNHRGQQDVSVMTESFIRTL